MPAQSLKPPFWGIGLLLFVGMGAAVAGQAGEVEESPGREIWRGLESSFSTPWEQFLDGTAPESLNLRLAGDLPFGSGSSAGAGQSTQGDLPSSPTLRLGLRYVPLTYWFANLTLYKYLRPAQQRSWNPDFDYSFGYDDWHPYTLSLVYSSYGGNRLNPDRSRGERVTRFNEGNWALGFKFPMPKGLDDIFLLRAQDAINCNTGFNYTPRYNDLASGGKLRGKRSFALGCRYSFENGWYFDFNLLAYPESRQKQPWDPDFTYGFGYFDWRPGTVSIQYSNYSGNRYPWNSRAPGMGRLRDGSLGLSWNTNLL